MPDTQLIRIKTISEYHKVRGLPKPEHPLISLVDYALFKHTQANNVKSWVFDFYSISLKRDFSAKMKYGQQSCDFDEGTMFFIAPGQVFRIEADPNTIKKHSGWILLVHPDFFWNTSMAKTIKQYEFFGYSAFEALHLSEKEEATIIGIMKAMEREYHSNIDAFSQEVILAQLELLLTYSKRFYQRQFITRKISNHKVLERLEALLETCFNSDGLAVKGLPTVQWIADSLNLSPNYLSGLLRQLTGQNTQQHIHEKLIEKAKEKLSATQLSVSEIAYELGFEHSQSFSKLFKSKTKVSPLAFRNSFN